MQPYKNLSDNGGVDFFSLGKEEIRIQFRDGSVYLYNYKTPGKKEVEQMKQLAIEGRGLTTFINRYVRERYARKIKDSGSNFN